MLLQHHKLYHCLPAGVEDKKTIKITFDQSSNYWQCDGTLWMPVDHCGYRHDRTEVLLVRKSETRVIIPNSHALSSHPVVTVNNTHAVSFNFRFCSIWTEKKPFSRKFNFSNQLNKFIGAFFFLFTSNVNSFGEYKSKYFIAFYATN